MFVIGDFTLRLLKNHKIITILREMRFNYVNHGPERKYKVVFVLTKMVCENEFRRNEVINDSVDTSHRSSMI